MGAYLSAGRETVWRTSQQVCPSQAETQTAHPQEAHSPQVTRASSCHTSKHTVHTHILSHAFTTLNLLLSCKFTSSDKESSPATNSVIQSSVPANNSFEGVKAAEEEEEGFVDPELPYQAAEDLREGDSFCLFPSRADEALKTCKITEQTTSNDTHNNKNNKANFSL